jgi:hypothetical protein
MKSILLAAGAAAVALALGGCATDGVYVGSPGYSMYSAPAYGGYGYGSYPYSSYPYYEPGIVIQGNVRQHAGRGNRDRDHDGIRNRDDADRDGDGVPNRLDARPNNPRRQ